MNVFPMTRTNLVKASALGCCLAAVSAFSAPSVTSLSPEAAKAVIGGTCVAPSASCKLNDVCVSLGGLYLYYVYHDVGQGFSDSPNTSFCRTVGVANTNCGDAYLDANDGSPNGPGLGYPSYWICT